MEENEPMSYREKLNLIRLGLAEKTTGPKPKKAIAIKSAKKIQEEKEAKESGEDQVMNNFFEAMRKKLTGTCACGCGQNSQKQDDTFYRFCICHIFPKKDFESIKTNPLNWVERTFWQGHHTNFDEQGVDKWPMYEDWPVIKEKFHELAPLLTDEERAKKFYRLLEELVYKN